MSKPASKLPTRLLLTLAVLGLLFIAVHFAAIAALRHVVEDQLHPALPQGTRIDDVELGLFAGLLQVSGFELRNGDELRIAAGSLVIDVGILPLLTGKVRVERLDLADVYLRVDRDPDGNFDLGLPSFGAAQPASADAASTPIDLAVARVRLHDVRIDYRDGEQQSELLVDRLDVGAWSLVETGQRVPVSWGMDWEGRVLDGEAELSMDGDKVLAASGRLHADPIDLARVNLLARLGQPVRGEVEYRGRFDWRPEAASLAGDLHAPALAYDIAGRRVALTGISVPGFQLDAALQAPLSITLTAPSAATIDGWDGELAGQVFTGERLSIAGVLSYTDGGTLDLRGTDYRFARLGWQRDGSALEIQGLQLTGDLQQRLDGATPVPAANVRLAFDRVVFDDGAAGLAVEVAGVELQDLALAPLDASGAHDLDGRLVTGNGNVALPQETSLSWQAVDAVLGGKVGKEVLRMAGDLSVSGLGLVDPRLGAEPLTLAAVTAEGLEHAERTRFARVRLAGLDLPSQPDQTSLRIDAIDLVDGGYAQKQGVELAEIVIDGLRTGVIRDQSGQWRYATSRSADAGPARAAAAGETAAATGQAAGNDAMPWRIGGLRIGGDSRLMIADQLNPDSTAPAFAIEKFVVGELASSAPDADTPFDIVLRPDEYSEFVFTGVTRPLSDLYLKAEGHLHGFAMQAFNGLIAEDLGHRFLDGQLDNDFTIAIEQQQLDMSNALLLASVDAEALPGKDGPPLTTAIALLTDRNGNIDLDVPVAGNLDDPNFRVLGALDPIIMKAVAGAAAIAIQPLGSALLVGTLVADQALKVTFNPALFDPGATELNAEARDYLGQLADKLNEKPKLGLKFCGVAVAAERKKDKQGRFVDAEDALLALAQARADAVGAYLRQRGVGENQVRACRPAFDAETEALPRVDIRL